MYSQKKAQSALEYMMTYGWAILIIVIVAVILYSMGIFNPASSITATSSGFSPFTPSSAICTTGPEGYTEISFVVGALPNGASSVTIDRLYLTSPSGFSSSSSKQSVDISPSSTVITGQTFEVIIPMENCSSVGTSFSSTASLQYSYSTLAGNVNTNATGTIAGKSSAISQNTVAEDGNIIASVKNLPLGTAARSVAAWIYISSPNNLYFLSYGTFSCTGLFGVETYSGALYYGNTCYHTTLEENTWYFVVNEFNGSSSNEGAVLYAGYGGNPVSSYTSDLGSSISTASSLFYLNDYHGEYPFEGKIADVQIYDTALSSSQVNQLYKEGLGGAPIANAGLIAWWPLDGNAFDYSGNNNNGVAYNVNWVSP